MSAQKKTLNRPRAGQRVYLVTYPSRGRSFGGEWDTSRTAALSTAEDWASVAEEALIVERSRRACRRTRGGTPAKRGADGTEGEEGEEIEDFAEPQVNLGHVDYSSVVPPPDYRCTTCGVHGGKLWREWQTFGNHSELLCCECAAKSERKDVSRINGDGMRLSEGGDLTDQIGWRVPAVPTAKGDGYWAYYGVPEVAGEWWRRLPTRAVPR